MAIFATCAGFYPDMSKRFYPDMSKLHVVHADWDSEAGVWVATSEDVPGLVTEAASLELLNDRLQAIVPELLEANGVSADPESDSFELIARRITLLQPGHA